MTNTMTRAVGVDFFCGAGGMTLGLIKGGVHVLAGVDNQALCRETYEQNRNSDRTHPAFLLRDIFPKTIVYPGGEQHLIAEEIEHLLSKYKSKTGYRKLDLIFAICAPCQPFTKITKIAMSEGRRFKRTNDSNLLLTTLRLIRKFQPVAIVCENVEGIADGTSSVLARFKRSLNSMDYHFDAKVINTLDFQIPQNRKRTIAIAIKRDRASEVYVPEMLASDGKAPTVREAIGHFPPLAAGEVHPTIPNHRARGLSEINLKRISCAPPGGSNAYLHQTPYGDLSLPCHRRLTEKAGVPSFSDTYTRMDGDEPSPTITTKLMSVSNGRFGHFDKSQNRALTPREGAKLQSFPDSYVFHPEDRLDFTCRLIGNAVPPKLAVALTEHVLELMR